MRAFPRRLFGRSLATLAGLSLVATSLLATTPAQADNVATPGNFTGYGFDQCLAPTQYKMNTWLKHSPYLAVGIYISGDSRACRSQPSLTTTWISRQLRKGWRLLPIALGPQASCQPRFPRYSDDFKISPWPGDTGRYATARKQGRAEANHNVTDADALGIAKGSTLWYDMEGFDLGNTHCRESALAFTHAWTRRVKDLGFVAGFYSSASSGIKMLDDARINRPGEFTLPDRIWIARWDGVANTSTTYIGDQGWRPGGRMKQYRGGHDEVWGGVRINIDTNYLDLGLGSVAPPVDHCNGTKVSFWKYPAIKPGSTEAPKVKALQCLLREKDMYTGRLHGRYNLRTQAAVARWQSARSLPTSTKFSRANWVKFLAEGNGSVLKFGSAGEAVRRVQRALNAARAGRLGVDGTFARATDQALRTWQDRVGIDVSGVVATQSWRQFHLGRY